jgi:integrase
MANMRLKLSDYGIARLKPPAKGRLEVADLIVPGLFLRITPRDVRSFSVAFKIRGEGGYSETGRALVGVQHRITLGRYPQLGLSAARDKARGLLETVLEGRDPRPARREAQKERISNTIASVAKRFIEQDAKKTVESWRRIERTLELHVLPTMGDRPIREIGRADIHDLLDGIVENTGPGAAYAALKHLHRLFEFALDRELVDRNPAHKLKRKDLKPNGDARRSLNDAELRAVWAAAGSLGYPFGPALRLLMLTGQRRNDWSCAARAEVDVERHCLEIPAARYKSRRDHQVPLVGPSWEIFNALPIQTGGDFLFSNRAGKVAINSWAKAKKQIDKLTGPLASWSLHDLRSTAESRMAALGIVQEHRDAVLGHARPGLQKIYNKFDYAEEKVEALRAYAAHLMEVVK